MVVAGGVFALVMLWRWGGGVRITPAGAPKAGTGAPTTSLNPPNLDGPARIGGAAAGAGGAAAAGCAARGRRPDVFLIRV